MYTGNKYICSDKQTCLEKPQKDIQKRGRVCLIVVKFFLSYVFYFVFVLCGGKN
jgi:hypothetical protein